MKLLLSNDWHFCKKNPASRTDQYNEELFASLTQIARVAVSQRVDAVCIAGDIFHDKGSALWDVVVRLLDWAQRLKDAGIMVLTISGNHDQTHDRYESLDATPYGVLVSSGLFTDISRRTLVLETPTQTLQLYGVPWPDGSQPDAFRAIPMEVDVVLAHGFTTASGEPRFDTFCHAYADLATAAPQVRLWHFGHDHTDHGVTTLINRAKVVNIGALARGILDGDSLAREVKVALATIPPDGGEVTVLQAALRVPPVEACFDLDRYRQRQQEQTQLAEFLDALAVGLDGVLDVDYHAVLTRMQLPAHVRASVAAYIQRAEAQA